MQIITYTCPNCGTIIAANVLESERIMKCPKSGCSNIVKFTDITGEEQEYVVENKEEFKL